MAEKLLGPMSREVLIVTFPPKKETFTTIIKGKNGEKVYTIESMISRANGEGDRKGVVVYVVPGSTKYVGDAPPSLKSGV